MERYGLAADNLRFDFAQVVARSRKAAALLSAGVGHLLKNHGVEVIKGRGTLVAADRIEVAAADGARRTLQARRILVATGGRPRSIPGVTIDGVRILSSREAMVLRAVPRSMIIVGAGAIGVEFAYFFSAFGCEVHLLEMLPRILPQEDEEISEVVARAFRRYKIQVSAGAQVRDVVTTADKVQLTYAEADGAPRKLEAEVLLMAVGVQGNVEHLGLEALGVATEGGFIKVDSGNYQTTCEGIFAVGDVAGPPLLAHKASAEGVHAIECLCGVRCVPLDYNNIPRCMYCQPQVASVGLTEKQALEKGYKLKIGRFPFAANGKALAIDRSAGLVKLIFDEQYGELLGAHIVGHGATELIGEIGVARTLGTKYRDLAGTVHAHPTLSEAIGEAAAHAYGEGVNL
jgi:dihydrolipoamide dehydrogenase